MRDGLDGLSVRKVALEAHVSVGAIQHHYATKDALLVASAEHITSQFMRRAEEVSQQAFAREGGFAAFAAFCELLANASPTESSSGDDVTPSIVWLWYAAKATQPGFVADTFARFWSGTEEYLMGAIIELFPSLDAADEAAHLLAVLDGIAIARAAEPGRMSLSRAQMLVRRHLDCLSRR
ncbi:hypothetical protein GCM10009786_18980 [Leucobacter alluvii]|uniref:HTH tetR-type domain-containing protein n=1 Tax=Leucobacter alluvii TaxID=340321 RepID=A0ABN3B6D0_9MICO